MLSVGYTLFKSEIREDTIIQFRIIVAIWIKQNEKNMFNI